MKDKEKQIEEMAKDLKQHIIKTIYGVRSSNEREKCANYLVSKGWIKPNKDSVVLSREEFENLGLVVETIQEYESVNGQPKLVNEKKIVKKLKTNLTDLLNQELKELQIAQARKETAEKILREVADCMQSSDLSRIMAYRIKELAKQFGVEIKE
jgi:hypothetical protein